jgi:hypothetical protein
VADRIERTLDHLDNRLSPEARRAVEAALIKKIGKPPTKAQREAIHQRAREILGDFADTMAEITDGRSRSGRRKRGA